MQKTLISILIFLSFAVNSFGQRIMQIPPEKPKLVVQIVVEQMRADYIQRFWDDFSDKGFKRLVNYGTVCANAELRYSSTQTCPGYATIATGTFPSYHGIIGDSWFNRVTGEEEDAVVDEKYKVVGGRPKKNQFSPRKLSVSCLADELQLFSSGNSKTLSIGLNANGALLLGGHASNGAYWFDEETGNWVTSNYYMHNLPGWVDAFNGKKIPDLYVQKNWSTSKLITNYQNCLPDKNRYESGYQGNITFPYNPAKVAGRSRIYTALKLLPAGNTLTKDFAIHTIVGEELGKDNYTDLLSVCFSATEAIGTQFGTESVELRDAFIKLDAEIGFLLDFISSEVGMNNTLVVLTSNHGVSYNSDFLKDKKMSAGEFKHRKAIVLLESYLNALYGEGDWVTHYDNLQIYLNHILIEDTRLDLYEVRERAAQFLIQVTGVAQIYVAQQLMNSNASDKIFTRIANSYNMKRSGDLMIVLKPGWTEQIVDKTCVHNSPYNGNNHVPLIWYGWKVEKAKINDPVCLTDIAPTIATLLQIPSPNMSTGSPIIKMVD